MKSIKVILVPPPKIPTDSEVVSGIITAIIVIGFIANYFLRTIFMSWQSYSFPVNYVAAFYHYTFFVPLNSIGSVWSWFDHTGLTSSLVLNVIIGLIGTLAYAALIGYLWVLVFMYIQRRWGHALWFYLAPAIGLLCLYLIVLLIHTILY